MNDSSPSLNQAKKTNRVDKKKTMSEPVSVLFVCLGNICRSTMAEGIFQSIAKEDKYEGKIGKIDSCGTGM